MVVGYGKLDVRYWPTKDPMVMGIVALELCIMGPLCILWYDILILFKAIYSVVAFAAVTQHSAERNVA